MRLVRNPISLAAAAFIALLAGCAFDSTGPSSPPVVTTRPATQPAYTNNPLENFQNNVSDLFN
jgi:hypothetical protein